MAATYVLQKCGDGRFMFTLKAHDGQVILTSPCYPDKDTALRRIDSARLLARRQENYELLTAENGQAWFVLKTARMGVIGQSEMYPDSQSAAKVITFARGITRGARLEDLTARKHPSTGACQPRQLHRDPERSPEWWESLSNTEVQVAAEAWDLAGNRTRSALES
jgi:uncharacterized protein YegP (UPF0339 family)